MKPTISYTFLIRITKRRMISIYTFVDVCRFLIYTRRQYVDTEWWRTIYLLSLMLSVSHRGRDGRIYTVVVAARGCRAAAGPSSDPDRCDPPHRAFTHLPLGLTYLPSSTKWSWKSTIVECLKQIVTMGARVYEAATKDSFGLEINRITVKKEKNAASTKWRDSVW